MRFLVDAQLPRRFVDWLKEEGHDAIHTSDLPLKNATPDHDVILRALAEDRVVVTKDDDFVQAYLLRGQPVLLLISTGNISNRDLEKVLRANLHSVTAAFQNHFFIEITSDSLIIHE
ncbi:MAG: DUF5615 family PIN-like protein [Polynucleobacter sp.]|nr:DUF5615 family PIN-like protein [Polynucleobacter sp.]MDZ4058190.1 DUF5615 family PIN-like protein [Polynucleobacter sp.]